MDEPERNNETVSRLAVLVIAAATLAAFVGVLGNGFVWDDQANLVNNVRYRGVSYEHLRWMFTTSLGGHYQPLTWLSFALDTKLWGGLNAAGVHLTNLLLHLATATLFFFLARHLLTSALCDASRGAAFAGDKCRTASSSAIVLGAGTAAILFAVHPLRVESVAWATERRDVLSGLFLMATLLLYVRSTTTSSSTDETGRTMLVRRRRRLLVGAIVCYLLSLMSKAWGMTLPIVLLLLDFYPLGRFRSRDQRPRESLGSLCIEKLLFLVPAASCAFAALWAQRQAGAAWSFAEHPLGLRLGQAMYGLAFYPIKTLFPTGLIPLYEQNPSATALDPLNVAAAGLVIATAGLLLSMRKKHPALLTTFALYVVILSPVLGLAQSGPQIVADRYSYLACLPFAVLLGGCVTKAWSRLSVRRPMLRVSVLVGLVAITLTLIALTRQQTRIWRSPYTLWNAVIEKAPQSGTAHARLAAILNQRGEFMRARDHAIRAIQRLPGNRAAHRALGQASMEIGNYEVAEKHLRTAALIAANVGKSDTSAQLGLAILYTRLQRFDDAEATYRIMIEADPSRVEWRLALAGLLASRDGFADAEDTFAGALRIDPTDPQTSLRLGIVQHKQGNAAAAIATWERGLEFHPGDVHLRAQLAWVLATTTNDDQRDGVRAISLARGALADTANGVFNLEATEALAAALAETGDFVSAVATLEAAQTTVPDYTDALSRAAERLSRQLKRYRAGKPTRVNLNPIPITGD